MRKRPCRGQKLLVIEEIGKVKITKSVAERINRCMMTGIGESVRIWKNPSKKKRQSDFDD